jgi:hypothetical protein
MLIAHKPFLPAIIAFYALSTAVSSQAPAAPANGKAAADNSPFVFKTSSRLVVVDVVATTGKGEPITDLKADDFVLSEDGHQQTVRSFSFQQPAATDVGLENTDQKPTPGGHQYSSLQKRRRLECNCSGRTE